MKDIYQQLEEEKEPKVKMELMLQLTKGFLNSDLAQCEEIAFSLLQLGRENGMPMAIMHHYLVRGRVFYRKGELQAATEQFKQAETIALEIGHLGGQGSCLEMFGVTANQQGRHIDALDLFMRSLKTFIEAKASEAIMGLAYNNIANTYNLMHQAEEAEKYYQLAIDTLLNQNREHTINLIKTNLGGLRYHKKQFAEAIQYFEAGLAGFIKQNNIQAQSQAYSHIGYCYLAMKEYAQSLSYFQKGLKLIRSKNFDNELSSIYQGLGELYSALGGHNEALNYLNKALKLRLKKSYWALACETYNSQYALYQQMNHPQNAQHALASGKKLSLEQGLTDWQKKFEALRAEQLIGDVK